MLSLTHHITIKTAKELIKNNNISTRIFEESLCVLSGIFFQSECKTAFKSFPCHPSAHWFWGVSRGLEGENRCLACGRGPVQPLVNCLRITFVI